MQKTPYDRPHVFSGERRKRLKKTHSFGCGDLLPFAATPASERAAEKRIRNSAAEQPCGRSEVVPAGSPSVSMSLSLPQDHESTNSLAALVPLTRYGVSFSSFLSLFSCQCWCLLHSVLHWFPLLAAASEVVFCCPEEQDLKLLSFYQFGFHPWASLTADLLQTVQCELVFWNYLPINPALQ